MNQRFAQNVEKGDLIVVPQSNYLYPGIFMGYGRVGNLNYVSLHGYDKVPDPNHWGPIGYLRRRLSTKGGFKNDYVSRTGENVFSKLNPEDADPALLSVYEEIKILLQRNGKL